MELIPAIDLLDGKAVRLLKGDYARATVYSDDAAALAASWSGRAPRLHVVDLEGSRSGSPAQHGLVGAVVRAFGGGVQVGGGVRAIATVDALLVTGVERVVLGTAAVRDPEFVEHAARRHPGRIVLAVDARGGKVATQGWLDQSELLATELVDRYRHLPLAAVLYTDIERDGTEVGPNVRETALLAERAGLPVIASGGVGTLEHLAELRSTGVVAAAIVGRALHEGRFTLDAALEICSG